MSEGPEPGARDSAATLPAFLREIARHGARTALVAPEHGAALSYAELECEARRAACALVAAGVVKGARVGLLLGNRPEFAVAWLAAGLVGAVAVPINTFAPADEIDWILRHADVSVLLLQAELAGHRFLAELLARHPEIAAAAPGAIACPALPQLRRAVCLGNAAAQGGGVEPWETFLARGNGVPDALLGALGAEVAPTDDALVIYTSGTTERPKGIVHFQRAPVLQSRAFVDFMRLSPDDRVLTAQPFFWTAGIAMSLGATLAAGACLVLQEVFEPGAALALLESERISVLHAWPHQEKALGEHPDAPRRDLSRLQKLRFGTALARCARREKDDWGVDASYGLSETFTIVSALPADTPAEVRARSHGRALPGMEIRIVDPETGAPLPTGAAGEIAVRGATLMRCYHKQPLESAFDAEGWFRTQDGGSLDEEGLLHWTGRLSGLVKTGGANVSPLEVESALRSYPGLLAALAVGVPHPSLGEALVLCAIARPGAEPPGGGEAIRAHLRARLAPYKVPRCVLFFGPDEIAYTGNQKIQAGPLRAAALARLAEQSAEIAGHRYGAG